MVILRGPLAGQNLQRYRKSAAPSVCDQQLVSILEVALGLKQAQMVYLFGPPMCFGDARSRPPLPPPPTYPPPTPPPYPSPPPPTPPPYLPPTSPPYLPPPTSPPYLRLASLDRRLASLDAGAPSHVTAPPPPPSRRTSPRRPAPSPTHCATASP